MTTLLFTVRKPGLFTTIQDDGRYGYQALGVPVSGAMDTYSHQLANILVGNRKEAAVLEITLVGPELYVESDAILAICGANLSPQLNGQTLPMWTSFRVKRGDVLSFGRQVSGARAYIAVQGEYAIPRVFDSQSTETKTALGGLYGRALQSGDTLYRQYATDRLQVVRRTVKEADIPLYAREQTVRIILGPHLHYFSEKTRDILLTESFTVSSQSDRMGYRLEGPKLVSTLEGSMPSEGTMFGTIQVPTSGELIILMADRQTTGGYPIIGTVISTDLPYVAQAVPGTTFTFQKITVQDAQQLYRRRERWFRFLEKFHSQT